MKFKLTKQKIGIIILLQLLSMFFIYVYFINLELKSSLPMFLVWFFIVYLIIYLPGFVGGFLIGLFFYMGLGIYGFYFGYCLGFLAYNYFLVCLGEHVYEKFKK